MRYAYADVYTIDLPPGHRFPMEKYRRTRELLLAEGTITTQQLLVPAMVPRDVLERTHTREYVERVFSGNLSPAEVRAIGLPWSPSLVRRSRTSVAGTLQAARHALLSGAGCNFAGGTHHAFADRGEGFCVFNDVAVAIRHLQADGSLERAAVVDVDVHQGNGTAHIFRNDANVFTLSLHGRNNWPFEKIPSTLDLAFDDGTGDVEYLTTLEVALERIRRFEPDLVFMVAGVDPLASDRLGKLSLTVDGLKQRDAMVVHWAKENEFPIAICFGGGYAEDIDEIVEAHANTIRVAEAAFPGG